MRIRDYFKNPIVTYATIGGIEYDSVTVVADYQPREYDTNVGEYVEVTSVLVNGVEKIDEMLQDELDAMEDRLLEMAYSKRESVNEYLRGIASDIQAEELASRANQRGSRV